MTGSSVAMGERVQAQESFAAQLPAALTEKTGRRVELYNESIGWAFSHSVTLRFKDVLAARPDLILWVLTPVDVERASLVLPTPDESGEWSSKPHAERLRMRIKEILTTKSGMNAIAELIGRSRTALMFRHFLYQSPSLYVNAWLSRDDNDAGFLRVPMNPLWDEGLKQVDSDAATIEAQARDAGIPFVAACVPNRAQVALASMGQWPAGIDPYQLDNKLRPIIESHGGTYIDLLPGFREIPNPEQHYLPVDGHPDPEGHAVLTRIFAKQLTSGLVPALSVSSLHLQ
jgi:hypothetical protein